MIILIDNYDSFSYNLYQLAGSLYPDIKVIRNDALSLSELEEMNPKALLISPGPGRPEDAGICVDAIRFFGPRIPILGVCLGHQAICQCYGATISYAKELVHGKAYDVEVDTESPLFRGMKQHATTPRPPWNPPCLPALKSPPAPETGKSWPWNTGTIPPTVSSSIPNPL